MARLFYNTPGQYVYFCLVTSTGVPRLGEASNVTVTVALDGGAPSAGAGTITEDAGGLYHYAPTQAETAGTFVAFLFTDQTAGALGQLAQFITESPIWPDLWTAALPGAYSAGEAGYILGHLGSPPDPWAVPLPGAYAAGEAGYILGHLGALGDPWAVPLPGAYAAGEAGYVVGNMALATASTVLSQANSIDVGLTLAQAVKLMVAVLAGQSTVSGFTVTYMDTTDTIARIVATLDGTGQRTAMVYNTT
jgi:hypothetical protein